MAEQTYVPARVTSSPTTFSNYISRISADLVLVMLTLIRIFSVHDGHGSVAQTKTPQSNPKVSFFQSSQLLFTSLCLAAQVQVAALAGEAHWLCLARTFNPLPR